MLVKRGYLEMQIEILELSENRGPAAIAQTLYSETENSKAQRKKMSDTIKSQPKIEFELRKPDKRGVREHRALKRRDN